MNSFTRRITENQLGSNGIFNEDFYLDMSAYRNSFLGFWGIGCCLWQKSYEATYHPGLVNLSFELITEGVFLLKNGTETVKLSPGDLLLVDAFREQQLQAYPAGRKWCVFFRDSSLSLAMAQKIFGHKSVIRLSNWQNIEEKFRQIFTAVSEAADDPEKLAFELLQEMYRRSDWQKYPPALQKVLKYLGLHHNWWCTREELANVAGVSVSTLNRLFLQYLHCSIGEYCQLIRIEAACQLLSLPGQSVKTVASECGFSSLAFFCRTFKKFKKCTPGEFIRNPSRPD